MRNRVDSRNDGNRHHFGHGEGGGVRENGCVALSKGAETHFRRRRRAVNGTSSANPEMLRMCGVGGKGELLEGSSSFEAEGGEGRLAQGLEGKLNGGLEGRLNGGRVGVDGEKEGGGNERRQLAGKRVDGAGGVGVEERVEKGCVSLCARRADDFEEEVEGTQGALRVTEGDGGNEEVQAEMDGKTLVGDLLAEKEHHAVGGLVIHCARHKRYDQWGTKTGPFSMTLISWISVTSSRIMALRSSSRNTRSRISLHTRLRQNERSATFQFSCTNFTALAGSATAQSGYTPTHSAST